MGGAGGEFLPPLEAPQAPAGASALSRAGGGVVEALLRAVLLCALAAGAAWLLTPAPYAQRLPGDEALGTPALGDYRAARDYDIVDEEATRVLRDAAAGAERSVYDYDDAAADAAAARIHSAFAAARDALAEVRSHRPDPASRASGDARRVLLALRSSFDAP